MNNRQKMASLLKEIKYSIMELQNNISQISGLSSTTAKVEVINLMSSINHELNYKPEADFEDNYMHLLDYIERTIICIQEELISIGMDEKNVEVVANNSLKKYRKTYFKFLEQTESMLVMYLKNSVTYQTSKNMSMVEMLQEDLVDICQKCLIKNASLIVVKTPSREETLDNQALFNFVNSIKDAYADNDNNMNSFNIWLRTQWPMLLTEIVQCHQGSQIKQPNDYNEFLTLREKVQARLGLHFNATSGSSPTSEDVNDAKDMVDSVINSINPLIENLKEQFKNNEKEDTPVETDNVEETNSLDTFLDSLTPMMDNLNKTFNEGNEWLDDFVEKIKNNPKIAGFQEEFDDFMDNFLVNIQNSDIGEKIHDMYTDKVEGVVDSVNETVLKHFTDSLGYNEERPSDGYEEVEVETETKQPVFIVVTAKNVQAFSEIVNDKLSLGYILRGNIVYTTEGYYSQAMVNHENG